MGATYTRQSTYTDGDTITADHTNDEFDQLLAAFAASTGHTHDGTAGEGGPISTLGGHAITFGSGTAGTDIVITFDGESNDGVLTWNEDLDYFEFSDDLLIATTEKIQFRDTGLYINSSTDGQLDIVADTEVQIAATTIDINGNTDVSGNLSVGGNLDVTGSFDMSDANITNIGSIALDTITNDGTDITLDSSGDIRLDAGGANVTIKDDGTSILDIANNSSDVELTVSVADKNFKIKGTDDSSTITALDIDMALAGKATFNGDVVIGGDLTISGDDLTMATNTAGHILVADGNNFNPTAVSSLDEIGTVEDTDVFLAVDATDNALKKITRSTLVSGLATSSAISNVVQDTTPQLGGDLDGQKNNLHNIGVFSASYGSSSAPTTVVVKVATKTTSHPYYADGSTSAYFLDDIEAPALTLHGVDNVTSDSGYYYKFDQADSSNSGHPLRFYLDAAKTTAYTTGVTTSGTPGNAGAYTQIDVDEDTPSILYYQCSSHALMGNYANVQGSNVINHSESLISFPTTTTTLIGTNTTDTLTNKTLTSPLIGTSILPVSADGTTLGSADKEFSDLFLADSGTIQFGNDQEITLTHVADNGLILKHAATGDGKMPTFTFQAGDTDIAADDELGVINFQAPNEGAGTDAILVAAGIAAVSEGDFSASNNATKLSFRTGVSEAASEKMSLSSAGLLTISDDFIIKDGGTIGSASDADAITIASDGVVTFSGAIVGSSTLSATTGTFSGILKTDDATEATSTTDGSLQTDGGLSVVKDAVFGDDIKLLSDASVIHFGADSEVTLTHTADTGLALKHTATADDKPIVLTLQTGETDMAENDVIGKLAFQAPDEGTGTDAILVAAAVQAVAEADFSSSNNATRLEFHTGASELASVKMTLNSTGAVKPVTYQETYVANSTGSTTTLDLSTGTSFSVTLSENTQFAFTLPTLPSDTAFSFTLFITQPASAKTIAWPGSVDWAGGSAPDAPGGSEVNGYGFFTRDGGTTYYGFLGGAALG